MIGGKKLAAWYEETVFYHMYPLGMSGSPMENKGTEVIHRFKELTKWIPHIEQMGCNGIYIGPLFESTTHGYDTRDYRMVDKRLGDDEDFRIFVQTAHDHGIRVIVDGVFNHTGREFFAFQDIQKNRENSHYVNWYKGIWFGGNTCYNDGFSYEAWRNCFELVNLNLQNPEVKEYLLESIHQWIEKFHIDGIRLDCADCLDFGFLEEMRRRTEEWKQEFWLMGEVIHGDYARYIQDGTHLLHSVTNYELHKGLYSGHNDHNYFEIAHTIRREFDKNCGIYKGMKLYSFVDNHDVDRLASKLNISGHLPLVYTLLYFLPGIPSIYYGSEWGIQGRKEGGNDAPLRPYLNLEEMNEKYGDSLLFSWIKKLGKIRKEHPESIHGEYQELFLTNRQYAFARVQNHQAVVIAVNNDEGQEATMWVPVPLENKDYKDCITGESCREENGKLSFVLPSNGVKIFSTR